MRSKIGVCQWFHYQDYRAVERTVDLLRDLGVRHLRTGISWADFHRTGGKPWYDWQMAALSEFEVLLSIWHTPPSISRGGTCASPPRRLEDFADFIEQVIDDYGGSFTHLELWNEPNNIRKWDFRTYDPEWSKFGQMVREAAARAKRREVPTVLGGMIPVDHHWLNLMKKYGVLDHIDVVAIHGFPEMWSSGAINWEWYHHWRGWRQKIASIQPHAGGKPIWITETGLATWEIRTAKPARRDLQVTMLDRAVDAPADRVYWYSLIDLDPAREAIEGFHVDENEYHMGLVEYDGNRKPAYYALKQILATRAPDYQDRVAGPAAGVPRR
jgi:CDP-paratose 2-epimerase